MKARASFRARLALLCLIALTPFGVPSGKAENARVDLREAPTDGSTPIVVSLGLYVTDLVSIDEARETFDVAGYIVAKWRDPRLALAPGVPSGGNQPRNFKAEDLWTPPIEGANSVSHLRRNYTLQADSQGVVTYMEHFSATLSSDLNMRTFPFDTNALEFHYHPFASGTLAIQFAPQALPGTGISPDPNTELAAWRILALRYTTGKTKIGFLPPTDEAVFQIVVKRRAGFYLWKIFLPLFILTLIPASTFWIDVKDIDWMLKVPMTMLLSMVAFEFAIARDLPRFGYLTFLDALFLLSFAFCFINILEITLVYAMQKNDRRTAAVRLHTIGRWAYPLCLCASIVLLAILFLG
jgi:hypothetical protein